jgi:hypothetical protein
MRGFVRRARGVELVRGASSFECACAHVDLDLDLAFRRSDERVASSRRGLSERERAERGSHEQGERRFSKESMRGLSLPALQACKATKLSQGDIIACHAIADSTPTCHHRRLRAHVAVSHAPRGAFPCPTRRPHMPRAASPHAPPPLLSIARHTT